jgi:hypothetical protein
LAANSLTTLSLLLTRGRRCGERRGAINMNDTSNTAAQLDQADEEIFTPTLSDEALEAAAGEAAASLRSLYYPGGLHCC